MDNLEIQPPDALRDTSYAVANILYRVFHRMDVGFEYYRGERENADGENGRANRLLFGVNYGF